MMLMNQHAFAVPEHKKGGAYNYMTYTMFDQVFWRAISGQVNRFRKEVCGIEATNFDKLEQHKSERLPCRRKAMQPLIDSPILVQLFP
jgi:hypothetical protein